MSSTDNIELSFENRNHLIFNKLEDFRHEGKFTDITLLCDGKKFHAHRLILAMSSAYFGKMLQMSKEESFPPVVWICGIRAPILQALFAYIYTGKVSLNCEEVVDFFNAGAMLEVSGLIDNEDISSSLNNEDMADVGGGQDSVKCSTNQKIPNSSSPSNSQNKNSPQKFISGDLTNRICDTVESEIINNESESENEKLLDVLQGTPENTDVKTEISSSVSNEDIKVNHIFSPKKDDREQKSAKTLESNKGLNLKQYSMNFHSDHSDEEAWEGWNENDIKDFQKHRGKFVVKGRKKNQRCFVCNRGFYKVESLERHMKLHSDIFHLTCRYCQKQFKNQRKFIIHVKHHEKDNTDTKSHESDDTVVLSKKRIMQENVSKNIKENTDHIKTEQKRLKRDDNASGRTIDDVLGIVSESFKVDLVDDVGGVDDSIFDNEPTDSADETTLEDNECQEDSEVKIKTELPSDRILISSFKDALSLLQ